MKKFTTFMNEVAGQNVLDLVRRVVQHDEFEDLPQDIIDDFNAMTSSEQVKFLVRVPSADAADKLFWHENDFNFKGKSVVKLFKTKTGVAEFDKEAEKEQENAKKVAPKNKIWYRGTRGKSYGGQRRDGYATFVTDNWYQAASYAGPDGYITEMTLDLNRLRDFNTKAGERYSYFDFDDAARTAPDGTAVAVYHVADTGPFREKMTTEARDKATVRGITNIAFKDPKVAKVKRVTRVDPSIFK